MPKRSLLLCCCSSQNMDGPGSEFLGVCHDCRAFAVAVSVPRDVVMSQTVRLSFWACTMMKLSNTKVQNDVVRPRTLHQTSLRTMSCMLKRRPRAKHSYWICPCQIQSIADFGSTFCDTFCEFRTSGRFGSCI